MMSGVSLAPLEGIATSLENYWGRNQVFRTCQFGFAMTSGLLQERFPALANKLLTVSDAIATMRATLRLLDDLPALVYTVKNLQAKQVRTVDGGSHKAVLVEVEKIWPVLEATCRVNNFHQQLVFCSLVMHLSKYCPTSPHPDTGGDMGGDLTTLLSMTLHAGEKRQSMSSNPPV